MSAAPVATALAEVLQAFDGPFGAACCRFAMRRAIDYLETNDAFSRELAIDILRATLRQVDGASP